MPGVRSFELSVIACSQLKMRNSLKICGEFYLKSSWLCRKVNQPLQEKEAQKKALEFFIRVFRPYMAMNNKFPSKEEIILRSERGMEILAERAVIYTGFLIAELSWRTGQYMQARQYFEEIKRLPFFNKFPALMKHVNSVHNKHTEGEKTPSR
ncbi:DUF2225 domain-containing protein [bacterium]|nr:DUF2225 domain-containing protein [bacterium]